MSFLTFFLNNAILNQLSFHFENVISTCLFSRVIKVSAPEGSESCTYGTTLHRDEKALVGFVFSMPHLRQRNLLTIFH